MQELNDNYFHLSSVMDQHNFQRYACVHFVHIPSFVIFYVRRCLDKISQLCKEFFDQNITWILNEYYVDHYACTSKGD